MFHTFSLTSKTEHVVGATIILCAFHVNESDLKMQLKSATVL